jgi:hypothetical protein
MTLQTLNKSPESETNWMPGKSYLPEISSISMRGFASFAYFESIQSNSDSIKQAAEIILQTDSEPRRRVLFEKGAGEPKASN